MMKNNTLTATLQRAALVSKLLLGFVSLGLVCLSTGCALAPSAVDSFIFTPTTNTVPVVTNYVRSVTVTNDFGAAETRNIVTWATNLETHVTYSVSTNAAALVKTGAAIGNIVAPGWGELGGLALGGLFGLWAKLKSRQTGAVMAQGTETLLAILEAEKGKAFVDSLKLKLVKDQNTAGVLREIAKLVETVDNDQAKLVAQQLLQALPEAQSPTS